MGRKRKGKQRGNGGKKIIEGLREGKNKCMRNKAGWGRMRKFEMRGKEK